MIADPRLTVALGEYDTGWHDPKASLAAADRLVERVSSVGVNLVVLPEMATTGFTMETDRAVSLDSADMQALQQIASRHRVWLVAGVALRMNGSSSCAVNGAVAIDPSGAIAAVHHKRRLFALGGEGEAYKSGEKPTIVEMDGVRFGLFICYELRFAEVFAEVAADVDGMIVIANWPVARQEHWDALLRARAIENQCFVVGVNRTGVADGLTFSGGSVVYDPWGARVPAAVASGVRVATVSASRTRDVRTKYPFLRDRQI